MSKKRGLWDNIHAKRRRIKNGSGERMRSPGDPSAPTQMDFDNSQVDEAVNNAMHRARLIKKIMKPVQLANHIKTPETSEPQSTNPNDSNSRFDGTISATKIYKKDTPGQ